MIALVRRTLLGAAGVLNDASAWLVLSFLLAGILHHVLEPGRLHRSLGNTRIRSLAKATVSGMLLPICSCGVIPLALSLYYSGAYLGPTLAFMAATPIINPAAAILAYGLLGPKITAIYVFTGFVAPMAIGWIGNRVAGHELHVPGVAADAPCQEPGHAHQRPLTARVFSGICWGFTDLGTMVSRYVLYGMLLVGLISAVVPASSIQDYLGNPGLVSLAGVAVLGAIMYVCAVGHIPFVAALVAAGASPGVAVTFLMTGAATNFPELISISRLIGRRAAATYVISLVAVSLAAGWATNLVLMPGFVPVIDRTRAEGTVRLAGALTLVVPPIVRWVCSAAVILLASRSLWLSVARLLERRADRRRVST
jgi:uncharacterized protein